MTSLRLPVSQTSRLYCNRDIFVTSSLIMHPRYFNRLFLVLRLCFVHIFLKRPSLLTSTVPHIISILLLPQVLLSVRKLFSIHCHIYKLNISGKILVDIAQFRLRMKPLKLWNVSVAVF